MKPSLYRRLALVFSILIIASLACALPGSPNQQQPTAAPVNQETQIAQTVQVMMTQIAQGGSSTVTPGATQPTLAATATLLPSATTVILPTATNTVPVIGVTPITQPTIVSVCDMASFVTDVTMPDGTAIPAGTQFIKTWRLKNTGSCTWTPDYSVVFESGTSMEGPTAQKIGVSVAPGQTVDVSVVLRAPGQPGSYRGYWRMRNAAGVLFGVGSSNGTFYVDIKATPVSASTSGYDFASNYCLAEWTGNDKAIPCLGKDGDTEGFVLYKDRPVLESGYVDDEPGLLTNPPRTQDGVIRGKYPAYTVKAGDRFAAIINCENNAKTCNVRFQLDYQIDTGAIQNLASWNEAYEGMFTQANVDLTALAGKNVRFILTVYANGASDGDRALWLAPKIVPAPPTATPTFTPTATLTPTATATFTATPTATESGYPAP